MPSKTDWEKFLDRDYRTSDWWFDDDGNSKYFKDEAEFLAKRHDNEYLSGLFEGLTDETKKDIFAIEEPDGG